MIQLAFAEPNPGPVKAQLARRGLLTDELRAPMPAASAARWRTACRRRWPSWTARFRRVERGAGVCRRADGASGRLCPLRIHLEYMPPRMLTDCL